MTKQQQANRARLLSRLAELGFTFGEAQQLRRIEMTLSRWSEHECNGTIQRDGEDGDGKPRRYWENRMGEHVRGSLVPDRERGALARLARIMAIHPELVSYHQTDPRGAALYIVSRAELGDRNLSGNYTMGVAICD